MSRAGAAERGFTLVELLVVLAILGLVSAVVLPRFRAWGDPSLRQVARAVAVEIRGTRTQAIRTGRIIEVPTSRIAARLPQRVRIEGAGLQFYPDGRSSGGRLELRDPSGTAVVAVDWLTGAVQVTP